MNYFAVPGLKTIGKKPNYSVYKQDLVINKVCQYFDIEMETLQSKSRKGEIVFARQICQWLLMKRCGMGSTRVGKLFNRDHSSVLHSINTIDEMLSAKYDNNYKEHLEQIKGILAEVIN